MLKHFFHFNFVENLRSTNFLFGFSAFWFIAAITCFVKKSKSDVENGTYCEILYILFSFCRYFGNVCKYKTKMKCNGRELRWEETHDEEDRHQHKEDKQHLKTMYKPKNKTQKTYTKWNVFVTKIIKHVLFWPIFCILNFFLLLPYRVLRRLPSYSSWPTGHPKKVQPDKNR